MKKLLFLIGFLALPLWAEKPTSYQAVENINMRVFFNQEIPGMTGVEYVPVVVQISGFALTGDNGRRPITLIKELGTRGDTPLTNKQIYNLLPTGKLREAFKDFYLEAISVDVTQ